MCIRATSPNGRDLVMLNGRLRSKPGVIPLSDAAGEIVEIGPSVTRFSVGDRVGVGEVLDVHASPEWSAVVKELTQGRGVDRIVDVGGPGTFAQSINAVAYHGQVSVIGVLTAGQDQPAIDFMRLFLSQA